MPIVRILCFNIHGGRSLDGTRDLNRLRTLMDEENIDISVLQEVETRSSRGGQAADLETLSGPARPYLAHGPSMTENAGWYGNLVVSRFPILRTVNHNLETSRRLEPRGAIDVTIDAGADKIRIIGTHLSLMPGERWREAQNLVKLIKKVEETERNPVFLMGDINEWRWTSRLLQYLDRTMIPVPCGRTFPSFRPFLKLDRVWHDTPGLNVTARALNGPAARKLSDHLPVLIEAELIKRPAV